MTDESSQALAPLTSPDTPIPYLDIETTRQAGWDLQHRLNAAGYLYRQLIGVQLGLGEDFTLYQVPAATSILLADGSRLETITHDDPVTKLSRKSDPGSRFMGFKRTLLSGLMVAHYVDPSLDFATESKEGFVFETAVYLPYADGDVGIEIGRSTSLGLGVEVRQEEFIPPSVKLVRLATGQHLMAENQSATLVEEKSWDFRESSAGFHIDFDHTLSGKVTEPVYLSLQLIWRDDQFHRGLGFLHPFPFSAQVGGEGDPRYIHPNRHQSVLDFALKPHGQGVDISIDNKPLAAGDLDAFLRRAALSHTDPQTIFRLLQGSITKQGDTVKLTLPDSSSTNISLKPQTGLMYQALAQSISHLFPQTEADITRATLPSPQKLLPPA